MTAEQVLVLDEAAEDLEQGVSFYEMQRPDLGVYFFDSLLADIESLRLSAGVHPVYFGLYRMLSSHFPFAVYYEYDGTIARVNAILDMRRSPAWSRNQLEQRI